MSSVPGRWPDLLVDFPELALRLVKIAYDIVAALAEMAIRLRQDEDILAHQIGIYGANLENVQTGLSDAHKDGRSVMRLKFASGQTLIYKPKPLEIEAEFNNAAHGVLSGFGILPLKVINRGAYGWVEDAGPGRRLDAPAELRELDLGRATGLFWLLNATDLHVENVLPGPRGTYALDLETLFSVPWIDTPAKECHWRSHSVTSTLLFDGSAFARSKIGNISGFDPTPSIGTLASEVDFGVIDDRIIVSKRQSARSLQQPASHARLVEDLVRGFRESTTVEARQRVKVFVENLPENVVLRFVPRETFFYARVLERLRQPKFLRVIGDRERDLKRLHSSNTASGGARKRLTAMINCEIRQLLNGDIPYFSYRLDDSSLLEPEVSFEPVFHTSARHQADSKITGLQSADIDEQTTLIRISLGEPPKIMRNAPPVPSLCSLFDMVNFLGVVIRNQCFEPDDAAARWLTLRGDVSKSDLRVSVGDDSFFAGTAGITLALQAAERITGNEALTRFLDRHAKRWRPEVVKDGDIAPVLGFSGLGGALFVAMELSRIAPSRWGHLVEWSRGQVRGLGRSIAEDRVHDVIGGSAGLLLALSSLGDAREGSIEEALIAASRKIGSAALKRDVGMTWKAPSSEEYLLSYAHGWAGMISALTAWKEPARADQDKTDELLEAALDWLETDFRTFGSFVDHRGQEAETRSLNLSWCNGSTGLLRGLMCCDLSGRPPLSAGAKHEFKRVLASAGRLSELRFCCGDMGLVDFLLDVSMASGDERLAAKTAEAGQACLSQAVRAILSGEFGIETAYPGLFQNLSGVLYVGCRLLDPELPSLSGQRTANWSPQWQTNLEGMIEDCISEVI